MSSVTIRRAERGDLSRIQDLLDRQQLASGDVAEFLGHFFVAEVEGTIAGTAGVELYGTTGLLRSAAVATGYRRRGIGRALVEQVVRYAGAQGVSALYLLTTSAEGYFAGLGFRKVGRNDVSGDVLASAQFRGACPATAATMCRMLSRPPEEGITRPVGTVPAAREREAL